MRMKVISILRCPNSKRSLNVFGIEVLRNNRTIKRVEHSEMSEDDEIVEGILIDTNFEYVYPIEQSIAILLNKQDAQIETLTTALLRKEKELPSPYRELTNNSLKTYMLELSTLNCGNWNTDEMNFFDKDVFTEEIRNEFATRIQREPLFNRYIPRQKHIIRKISHDIQGKSLLEIGCGNARTIYWIMRPSVFNYKYLGIDISFKRLLLAKKMVPEGDYVQGSVLYLPFADDTFDVVISFGVLHHLSEPLKGLKSCACVIKMKGMIAFHEPILKKKLISKEMHIFFRFINSEKRNPHDGEIDLSRTLQLLKKSGFEILHKHQELSIIGTIAIYAISHLPHSLQKKELFKWSQYIDQLFIQSFANISNRLGPSGVLLVARKVPSSEGLNFSD